MAAPSSPRTTGLPLRILLGLVVGMVAGLVLNWTIGGTSNSINWVVRNITEPVGQLFLRLLLMIVIPLVFSSLIVAIAGIGDIRKLGRVGFKSFGYCLVISAISVVIAIALANVIRPGKRISPQVAAQLQERYSSDASQKIEEAKLSTGKDSVLLQVVKTLVPSNPVHALASATPNLLHLMFFSLLLGIGITLLPSEKSAGFLQAVEGLYAVSIKIIDLIMLFAPYAVACLVFTNTALFGPDLLISLGWFVGTVLLGLSLQMFGVYSLAVYFLSKISPWQFFYRIRTVILTAFSTSSSSATLPTTLRVSEEQLGVPRQINNFVLTIGATGNQNGTALYEGITVLFLAQLAGVDLSVGQQLVVAYMSILGSIGTAGVPSGSIPYIVLVLATIGVDPLLIGVILGVDRILDMCRTTVNVAGDLTAATFVAQSEGYPLMPKIVKP